MLLFFWGEGDVLYFRAEATTFRAEATTYFGCGTLYHMAQLHGLLWSGVILTTSWDNPSSIRGPPSEIISWQLDPRFSTKKIPVISGLEASSTITQKLGGSPSQWPFFHGLYMGAHPPSFSGTDPSMLFWGGGLRWVGDECHSRRPGPIYVPALT